MKAELFVRHLSTPNLFVIIDNNLACKCCCNVERTWTENAG